VRRTAGHLAACGHGRRDVFNLTNDTMRHHLALSLLALFALGAGPAAAQSEVKTDLYTVRDGYKVDAATMKGFRTWRAAACDRCHGANQEGMVGPSLVNSLKTLSKDDFIKTVRDGRLDKGMQSFGTSQQVMDNINQLYAYLKGRSDGAITRSKVEEIQ
jgi:mono/diheme cytochrome c family protein